MALPALEELVERPLGERNWRTIYEKQIILLALATILSGLSTTQLRAQQKTDSDHMAQDGKMSSDTMEKDNMSGDSMSKSKGKKKHTKKSSDSMSHDKRSDDKMKDTSK